MPVPRTLTALVAAPLLSAAVLGIPSATAAVGPTVTELHYDNAGTDTGEAVEVLAEPGADLSDWRVVLYNGRVPGAAVVYGAAAGSPVGVANAAGYAVVTYPSNGIQNGSPDGLALVRPDGGVAEFLSYEGVLTASDGPAAGLVSTDLGVAETGAEQPGQSLQLVDGTWTGPVAATLGGAPGGGGGGPVPPAGTDCSAAPTATPAQVQGAGETSPLVGTTQTLRATVVADLQDGGLGGVAVQDAGDGDPATSDGLFVFAPDAAGLALGDVVQATGTVVELNGLTELSSVTALAICSTGAPLPAAAPLDLPASDAVLEQLESMRVRPVDVLTVSEVYGLARFGELLLSEGGTLLTATDVVEPGEPARAYEAANALRDVVLDDGRSTNLTAAGLPAPYLAPGAPVRVGDTVAVGALEDMVLGYGFGAYRLQPSDGVADGTPFTPTSPRTPGPTDVGGDLRVGSYNVLNYFVTFGPGSRGAADPAALARQQGKIVAGITALDADVLGLQEIENSSVTTPEDPFRAVRTLVDAVNAAEGAPVWDFVRLSEASDVITNAIIFRTDRVSPLGAPRTVVEDAVWDNAREPLAQTFRAAGDTFSVIANHFKSKGSGSGAGNTDIGDGQGRSNADRVAQARSLVDFAATVADAAGDPDVIMVGDVNAYSQEDPVDVIRAAGFTDLVAARAPGEHSYVFGGRSGSLDHSFASPSLAAKVTGVDVWEANAVESAAYQYDGSPALYAADAFRASDHNPEVVGLDLR